MKKIIEKKITESKEYKGTKCEVYSRVVGYHRPVENWNEGKQEEFDDRFVYGVENKK
jgi:anaerobic ribonucleoside-triphosphate reductase